VALPEVLAELVEPEAFVVDPPVAGPVPAGVLAPVAPGLEAGPVGVVPLVELPGVPPPPPAPMQLSLPVVTVKAALEAVRPVLSLIWKRSEVPRV